MKSYVLLITFFIGVISYCQDATEFPTLVPPTPNAAALHSYGNNSVSYYSGTSNVSIPIFTIQDGGVQIPITLNYSGGNGIRVEEQASWVGLGWTLNAGGAVSRTKRGVADEAAHGRGFLSYTELPREKTNSSGNVTNFQFISDISKGRQDGEPDKFMYNMPSGSGAFFINYDETIHQKPYKNVAISYGPASSGYVDTSVTNCHATAGMEAFYINDESGMQYAFEEKERSNSRNLTGSYYDQSCYPTSWYLTKVTDANAAVTVALEYDDYFFSNIRLNTTVTGSNEVDSYVQDYFLGKRLKKITHSQGSVEFVVSSLSRKDIEGNNALEKILIKDKEGNIIKEFHFGYNYFTPSALVPDSNNLALSKANRLALTSLQEVSIGTETIPPYQFTYNTDHFLPETNSKAKDHWGYFNGKTSNTKFQARQLARWFNGVDGVWEIDIIGSANREPNAAFAKAGILEQIVYPTGGFTNFEYEGNQAISKELQGALIPMYQTLETPNQSNNITIDIHSGGAQAVEMTLKAIQYPNSCTPIIKIKNTATNAVEEFSFEYAEQTNGGVGGLEIKTIIDVGNYDVSFYMQGPSSVCNPTNFDYLFGLSWDNQSNAVTKAVGGVRIKKTTNTPSVGTAISQHFDYTNNNKGESSGSIVSVPTYWFQNYTYYSNTNTPVPLSLFHRSVSSQYPLTTTGGNVVGYSKVTVTQENGQNGKTEYYFSGPEDFPDKRIGYIQKGRQRGDFLFQGTLINTYPVVTENSREYLRGKLLQQIEYAFNGSTYDTVAKTENRYKIMSYDPDLPGQEYLSSKSLLLKGINIAAAPSLNNIKEYEIHSGYMKIEKSVSKQYFGTKTYETVTEYNYPEDVDGALTHFVPLKTTTTNSKGETQINENYYVFNAQNNPDRDITQDAITNILSSRNSIYLPTQTNTFKQEGNGPLKPLSKQQTLYKSFGSNNILPHVVKTAKGATTLKERLFYNVYDGRLNPLDINKKEGAHTSFIWGYNKTRLIAKIENATYPDFQSHVANLLSLSNLDNDNCSDANCKEQLLRNGLQALRNDPELSNAMVTTYTYDPLIGVTSITDPKGYTMYYKYDDFNRLKHVKDAEGHILSENNYRYTNQN